jgi:hypothetical protein
MTVTDTTSETLVKLPASTALDLIAWAQWIQDDEPLADMLYLVAVQAPSIVQAWLERQDDLDLVDLLRLGAQRANV